MLDEKIEVVVGDEAVDHSIKEKKDTTEVVLRNRDGRNTRANLMAIVPSQVVQLRSAARDLNREFTGWKGSQVTRAITTALGMAPHHRRHSAPG